MVKPVVVDFETEAIGPRPKEYPPKPVGVAIKNWDLDGLKFHGSRRSGYLAWGHPVENTCTMKQAGRVLRDIWRSGRPVLFHHSKFDEEVAEAHFGLSILPWHLTFDSMYEVFLENPHAPTFSLKPSAERILNMPPDERDELEEWIIENVPGATRGNAGAFICKAPGKLVGAYAVGDVVRTEALHEHIYPELDEGMRVAYDRERRLMPVLLRNEQEGMRVDVRRLEADIATFTQAREHAGLWLRKALKVPDLNLDSKEELADALAEAGIITDWTVTPKSGKRSTAKKNMGPEKFNDPRIAAALGYYNRLGTCLSQSMEPWLAQARENGGLITTVWNQVRQSKSDDSGVKGTRTGRLSCSRFMNISKDWTSKQDGYVHPKHLKGLPELPLVRRYILPDKGHLFGHRDYDQQELRILAHFENDKLCRAYQEDPTLDMHAWMKQAIHDIVHIDLERPRVKILNFGLVYGMGIGALAAGMKVDTNTASALRRAQRAAVPGLKKLEDETRGRGRSGQPIRTWGGRLYYCEEPKVVKGKMRTFEYKLLNYLIQGSAADCTKEAVIRYDEARKDGRFMVTVHDEINISAPKARIKEELKVLRDVMASIEFDVPMLSSPKVGPSWGDIEKFKEVA